MPLLCPRQFKPAPILPLLVSPKQNGKQQHHFRIFPGVLLDDYGTLVVITDPKIYGALTAIIVGYFSKNVILTIISGLASYWFLIFVFN